MLVIVLSRLMLRQMDYIIDKLQTSATYPDSKVHGANMGPTWDPQDPG